MVKQAVVFVLGLASLVSCNVDSTAESTGGVMDEDDDASDDDASDDDASDDDTSDDDASDDDASDDDASDVDGGAPTTEDDDEPPTVRCPRGTTTVLSDYFSTQIALGDVEGETLSASFVSTGSSETQGMAFALSGDVGLPSAAPESGLVVLLDRFGTNVITWLDPASAEAVAQLPVGTGFESNPNDYVEVSDDLAFVTRLGQNAAPGHEDFDTGGDILVIDTETFEIVDAIEFPVEGEYPPGPSSMFRFGDRVIVNLDRNASDFSSTADAQWASVSIDDHSIEWLETLEGLKECGRPAPSPDGTRWAVACTGRIEFDGTIEDLSQSAILIFDPSEDPPVEVQRFAAEELVGEPLQDGLSFASDDVLLIKTQTPFGGATNNRLLAFDLESEEVTELLEARPDPDTGGKGIVYGRILCAPGCSDVCLMSDADRGVLQRISVGPQGAELDGRVTVETRVGLPPVGISYR